MEPGEVGSKRTLTESGDDLPSEVQISDSKCFSWRRLISIEIIVFGVFLADTISDSVTTNFILMRTCDVYFHFNKSICASLETPGNNASDIEAQVQPYSAVILTSMSFLSILFPAISSLFLGPWSDYNGRKPVLILVALGYFFKYILLGIFSWIPDTDPRFGLVAVLPVALSGGMVNFISAAYSYASDVSSPENRSFRISVLESFLYLSFIIGLLCTSYIYKAGGVYGYTLIYGVSASIVLLAVIPTYFFVPESVKNLEKGKGLRHVFEAKLFKEMIQVCFKRRKGWQRAVIFLVVFSLSITIASGVGELNVLFLFMRLHFKWNIQDFTLWASISSACGFIGLLLGTLLFMKWLKLPDPVLAIIAYSTKAASAFYIAFTPSNASYMLYYAGLISIFGGLCGPAGRAVLSNSIPKEDLGKLFALTGSSEALFPLAIGPLYTFLYNYTIDTLPSAFFILSGSIFIMCCSFYIFIYFAIKSTRETSYDELENENTNE